MFLKTPPMGWNSWNTFGEKIDEKMIAEMADAMVDKGFRDAGYEYLVIDDCWSERHRDEKTGKIVASHEKFPSGMKATADYVHSKGLKFGMYSCAGVRTCADYPGSFDHEYLDAETFAEWGVDFLKYDFCNKPDSADGPLLYRRMGHALRACGRDILFSACNWGCDDVYHWVRAAGADMYRSTGDIQDNFDSFTRIAQQQAGNFGHSAPGCFNDMDMLTVGMYGNGNVGCGGCNDTEYKSQFATWCLFGAPLMLGCDLRTISEPARKLLLNPELIALNQDPECRGPLYIGCDNNNNAYMRHLSGNRLAIGLFNLHNDDRRRFFFLRDLGLTPGCGYHFEGKEVFTGEPFTADRDYVYVDFKAHDCTLFIGKIVHD